MFVASDPALAARAVVFGLKPGGGPGSGHVWLEGEDCTSTTYVVSFRM